MGKPHEPPGAQEKLPRGKGGFTTGHPGERKGKPAGQERGPQRLPQKSKAEVRVGENPGQDWAPVSGQCCGVLGKVRRRGKGQRPTVSDVGEGGQRTAPFARPHGRGTVTAFSGD